MLLPADITPARRCISELAAVPEGASRLLAGINVCLRDVRQPASAACVHGSRRTGHEPAKRRDPERSVSVPLISLGQRGFARPAHRSLRSERARWSRPAANDAAYLVGNAGNLRENLESTSSRSCAVACRLPEARRLRRRHVWRGTSLAGKCSLPDISTAAGRRDTLRAPAFLSCARSVPLRPSSLIEAPDTFRLIQRRRHAEAHDIIAPCPSRRHGASQSAAGGSAGA